MFFLNCLFFANLDYSRVEVAADKKKQKKQEHQEKQGKQ